MVKLLLVFCALVNAVFVPLAPPPVGRPPLHSSVSTTVFVNLLDLNDNDPIFLNLPFVAEVPEGLPSGSSVFKVSTPLQDILRFSLTGLIP